MSYTGTRPFAVLTPEVIHDWLNAVARRPLTPEELAHVPLTEYEGASGLESFTLFGYRVGARVPAAFEALRWTLKIAADIEGEALLGTAVEILPEDTPPMPDRLHLIQVLSGEIRVTVQGHHMTFGPDDFCVLEAGHTPKIETHGLTAGFYINLPRKLLGVDVDVPLETSRLIAVLEFARAVLVEQLTQRNVGENNLTLLRFLLAAPAIADQAAEVPAATATIRGQAALLVEQHHQDPEFDVDALAKLLHISRRQLYRHYQDSPTSVAETITAARVQTAKLLLQDHTDLALPAIATISGFASEDQLRRHFQRREGMSPSHFRKTRATRL